MCFILFFRNKSTPTYEKFIADYDINLLSHMTSCEAKREIRNALKPYKKLVKKAQKKGLAEPPRPEFCVSPSLPLPENLPPKAFIHFICTEAFVVGHELYCKPSTKIPRGEIKQAENRERARNLQRSKRARNKRDSSEEEEVEKKSSSRRAKKPKNNETDVNALVKTFVCPGSKGTSKPIQASAYCPGSSTQVRNEEDKLDETDPEDNLCCDNLCGNVFYDLSFIKNGGHGEGCSPDLITVTNADSNICVGHLPCGITAFLGPLVAMKAINIRANIGRVYHPANAAPPIVLCIDINLECLSKLRYSRSFDDQKLFFDFMNFSNKTTSSDWLSPIYSRYYDSIIAFFRN